jgi:hypothetical protein
MKIGFVGCSHSTNSYGISWAHHMKRDLGCELIDVSISGASNEFFIEKIKKTLETNNNVDCFIIQLTELSRYMVGLYGNNPNDEYKKGVYQQDYTPNNIWCHRTTNGISYYNFLINNDNDLNNLLETNYNEDFLHFIKNHVIISDYNLKIKIFHTLLTMKGLFDYYNKKVLFFSWNTDIIKLADENGYGDIIKQFNIIEGSVIDFANKNNLKKVNSIHYGTDEHKIIYDEFLKSHINKFIKNS